MLSEQGLNDEIEFAVQVAQRALMILMSKYESIFPQRKEPWYQATGEDSPE